MHVNNFSQFPQQTSYLAESPFSCQTSIVPVTRSQFYLVVQINMNNAENETATEEEKTEEGEEVKVCKGLPLLEN